MEKHLSKIIGYAEEIEAGKEGDEETMKELAIEMRKLRQVDQELKKRDIPGAFERMGEVARVWRRTLQGAKDHSHADTMEAPEKHNVKSCVGKQCSAGHTHG